MKNFILIVFLIFITGLCSRAEAFWNPFKNIYIGSGAECSTERQNAENTINKLVMAYESRRINSFMKLVSEDFTGDKDILENSVRNDFFRYSFIEITWYLNNAISDSKDKIAVSLNFTRRLEERSTGKIISDTGTTQLILKEEDGIFKLYDMKRPYLFGINNN